MVGWPWHILGAICTVARDGEPGIILLFCQVNNTRLYQLPIGEI